MGGWVVTFESQIVGNLMHDQSQEVVAGAGEGVGEEEEEGPRRVPQDDRGQDLSGEMWVGGG